MKTGKSFLHLGVILSLLLSIMIPLVVFISFSFWPFSSKIGILFCINLGISTLISLLWLFQSIVINKNKKYEASTTIVEIVLLFILEIVPFLSFIFTFPTIGLENNMIVFSVILIIDLLIYVAFIVIFLYVDFVNKKMAKTLSSSEPISFKPINDSNEYNDENGLFKGSSFSNKKKD